MSAPPAVLPAAPDQAEQERRAARREQRGTAPVDRTIGVWRAARHRHRDHRKRERADGKVDVEDPPPRRVVDDEPAHRRPDDRGRAEYGSDQALVAAPVTRGHHHADDGDRKWNQSSGAEPLHCTEDHELRHVLGNSAERRAGEEHDDRKQHQALPAVDVAELPVEGDRDGAREHVRGEDP